MYTHPWGHIHIQRLARWLWHGLNGSIDSVTEFDALQDDPEASAAALGGINEIVDQVPQPIRLVEESAKTFIDFILRQSVAAS